MVLASTYGKRAHQLVKKQRAAWINNDAIMIIQPEEVLNLDLSFTEPRETLNPNRIIDVDQMVKTDSCLEDKVILDIAKRRVDAKRDLMGQVLDFCLLLIWLTLVVAIQDTFYRFVMAMFFFTFWGIRLTVRVVKFAKPSFKNGIATYFKERRRHKIEYEYSRLKKMSSDAVMELNK